MVLARRWTVLVMTALLIDAAPSAAQTTQPTGGATSAPTALLQADMPALIRRYRADKQDLERFHDIELSERRAQRLETFHKTWLDLLTRLDFDRLDQDGKIDYVLLRSHLENELTDILLGRRRRQAMAPLLAFARNILTLESSRRTLEPIDPKEAAGKLLEVKEKIAEIRKSLERGVKGEDGPGATLRVSQQTAFSGARAAKRLARVLEQWYSNAGGFDPVLTWWVKAPYDAAMSAIDDYAKYLREQLAGVKGEKDDPLIGEPIGADILDASLAHEMLPYSAQKLVEIGEAHFAWCETEMKKAAAEMGFGDDWKKALDKVKSAAVDPGKQLELVAAQAKEAIAFCDQHELVTIPDLCRETWRLDMLSSEEQKTFPFANYGGLLMNVAFPSDAMDHERKLQSLRGNNRHFSRLVTPHELIPGHHLQAFHASRERSHRSLFNTPFLVEGWAVFGEMLFWEKGFPAGPEDRIGALLWRMHRCARITVSLKFHLGEMQPAEMIDHLVERVGLERDGATGEVRRYIGGDYSPLYQCGYLIGALQIQALRVEVVDSGRATMRQFNDFLLAQNAIPIDLIRLAMLGTPPARDHRSTWKFAGE